MRTKQLSTSVTKLTRSGTNASLNFGRLIKRNQVSTSWSREWNRKESKKMQLQVLLIIYWIKSKMTETYTCLLINIVLIQLRAKTNRRWVYMTLLEFLSMLITLDDGRVGLRLLLIIIMSMLILWVKLCKQIFTPISLSLKWKKGNLINKPDWLSWDLPSRWEMRQNKICFGAILIKTYNLRKQNIMLTPITKLV